MLCNDLTVDISALMCYHVNMNNQNDDTVGSRFFLPLDKALKEVNAKSLRQCPVYEDMECLRQGIGRVMEVVSSGRDWVQSAVMSGLELSVGTFFTALRSQRRTEMILNVCNIIRWQVDLSCPKKDDLISTHSELDGYDIYASDGHYEKAASHMPAVEGKVHAQCCFFSLNLRTHSLSPLDIARPKLKKEHDMHALKRLSVGQLRLGAPVGRKVIHVYDPAALDYEQWEKWKAKGIYLLSREKENSAAVITGVLPFDKMDPRNAGVISDELVGVFCGLLFRRVKYRDAATGTEYSFITNLMTLPPGLIAFIYKCRWNVEKVFDEKKNKLFETKNWGITEQARLQQACFVCLAHNLMLILERQLGEEGIRDEKVIKRREKREKALTLEIRGRGEVPNEMAIKGNGITQRSLQFIRWLRLCLRKTTSWEEGVVKLRPLMEAYMS